MTSIHTLPPFTPNTTAAAGDSSQAPHPKSSRAEPAPEPERNASNGAQPPRNPLDKIGEIMEARLSELMGLNIRLALEHDTDADAYVYKAVNRITGEVIRQYPTEDMLKLMSYYHRTEGLSVNSRA